MGLDNRQQEIRMDTLVGGFLLEEDHRDNADLAKRCRAYAESVSGKKVRNKDNQSTYFL